MLFLSLFISPGSVEALVRRGWKIKYLLTDYFPSNIFAKNYQYRFIYVRGAARKISDIFGTQCIWLQGRARWWKSFYRKTDHITPQFISLAKDIGQQTKVGHGQGVGVACLVQQWPNCMQPTPYTIVQSGLQEHWHTGLWDALAMWVGCCVAIACVGRRFPRPQHAFACR